MKIQSDGQDGIATRPAVTLIVQNSRPMAPKQNLQKPEKSIQLMQQRRLGGLKPPPGKK